MADVNANIGVHIDASAALAELKNLQRQLATFHASIAKGSAASAMAQKNLQTNLLNSINATGQFTAQMGLVRTSTESFTHALEKNKLGMKEYFRYAGGATKTFGRLFKQEFDTIEKVAQERVKRMQTQFIKMGRDANGAMKAMSITPTALNMKDLGTQTQIAAQKQALFNQLVRQGSTNLLNFGKNTQWAGRQLMVGFTVPLAYLGTVAAKTFMDLEKQAIRFKRVYGDMFTTTDDTAKALKEIELLAQSFTKYGVAVVDTMEMAADAAAMGKTGAELTAQVAQATRLAVLGSVEQQQALETTISLTNAFGVAAEDLTSKIDFLNSVENQTVVSIEDLTIAIPKAGPVVQQLGGDVEDLAFFLTAMKEGGINASEGANALKSGLASLINPSKKASAFLNDLGVNINAIVEGNKGNIRETVIDFSEALDTLDPLNRARAIEQLFGKFQFSRLSTLFQNVTKDGTQAARVLELAGASIEELAILSERELKAVEDSVGTNFKAAMEDLKLTLAPIGKEFLKAVTPIIKVVGGLLEKFNDLSDGTKKFVIIATTIAGLVGPTLLMTFGLLANGAANIIKLFLALRTGFMKLGGNSKVLAEQTNYMTMEQLEAATVATSLNQAHTRLTQSFNIEAVAVRALRQAYVDATVAAAKFAMTNPGMMVPGAARGIKPGKNNLVQKPKGFSSGTTGLPGPMGAGDIIPILAAPGEAIIPSNVAQDPKFKPIISAMVNGTLQGFVDGTDNVQPFANSPKFQAKIDLNAGRSFRGTIGGYRPLPGGDVPQQLPADNVNVRPTGLEFEGTVYNTQTARRKKDVKDFIDSLTRNSDGSYTYVDKKTGTGTTIPAKRLHEVLSYRSQPGKEFTVSDIKRSLSIGSGNRGSSVGTSRPQWIADLMDDAKSNPSALAEVEAIKKDLAKRGITNLTQDQQRNLFGLQASHIVEERDENGKKIWRAANIVPEPGYINNYINTVKGTLGKELMEMSDAQLKALNIDRAELKLITAGVHPTTGDAANTLRGIAEYQIAKNPNSKTIYQAHSVVAGMDYRRENNVYAGGIKTLAQLFPTNKKVQKELGISSADKKDKKTKSKLSKVEKSLQSANIQTAGNSAARDAALEEVAARTKSSPVGDQDPEQYARQLTKSSGYSFSPAPGIAGLYEKPDGTKVFVKPTMDYASAIAEQRGTIIARDVHGLEAPEQTIKTMIDPTDETGQRKLIVLESPYDERFDERKMSRTFTKDEYVKQLLASGLRGDKDLKAGNLGGSVLADVGPAGVFNKASGVRDYSTAMPSVFEMMQTNVREVPGDFAGKSPFWFSNTTADVARSMTADEFATKMDAEVSRTTKALESTIKGFNLVDPPASDQSPQANNMRAEKAAYELMLKRIKAAKGENWKEIHRLHTSIAVKPDELLQDDKTGELEKPKTKPKPSGVKSTGGLRDKRTTQEVEGKSVVQRPRNYRMRGMADAPDAQTTPGIRIVDAERQFRAEQNSLRRQLEKLEKIKIVEAKKEIKQQRKQSETRENLRRVDNESIKAKIKDQQDLRMKQATDDRMARQQNRMMKLQGIGMAAGMASGGAYMSGNAQAGNALMAVSVLATMGPMLASPMMAAIVGLTSLGGSMLLLRRAFDKSQDDTMKMTESLGAGNQAIQNLAVFAGKVSASEIMDRRRSSMLSPYAIQTGKTTFGQSFVKSEDGKSMVSNVGQAIKDGGSAAAQSQVLNQMSTAVASGALTADQARSIVANLATELGDYSFGINVNAKLIEILGPNGENLATSPLEVRMKLMEGTRKDLAQQSKILGNAAPGALTKTQGYAGVGAMAGTGALAGASIGAIAGPIGAAIGAGLGTIIGAGAGYLNQKDNQQKLGNASGATVAMQKMAIEQSQQMQDSLRLEYEKRIDIAKAAGNTVEALKLQGQYELANAKLLTQNGKLTTDIQNTYKNSSGAVRGALETGLDKQITNKYKGTVNADIAPLASDLIKGSALSKEQQFTIKMQVASGQMDPMQIVNFMQNFGNNKKALSGLMTVNTKFGGAFAGQAMSVANLFQDKKGNPLKQQQTDFLADISSKTSKEADKYLALFAEISRVGNVVPVGVALSFYNDNPAAAILLQETIDKINAAKGKINLEVDTKVVGAKEMEILKNDQEYFDKLPAEQQKIYLRSLTTLVNMAGNNKEAVQNWLKANPGKTEADYYVAQTQALTKIGIDNTVPGGKGGTSNAGEKKRDTTYDDILTTLKKTRDATINAQGGAKELMRILGGKKDLQFFKGIDQQLSKLGANSEFIDFIGGVEKAVQNKLIKINKKGVVSFTDLGKAAKKAYDEKQLGLFSAKSAQAINEAQKQRKGFVALKAAGVESADAVEMLADSTFMVSLAAQKNPAEIKRMIAQWKLMKKEINLTAKETDPQQYFKDQRDIAEQALSVEERIARLRNENSTRGLETELDNNNKLIDAAQRRLEVDESIGNRRIDVINSEIEALQRSLALGIDKQTQALDEESRKLSEDQTIIGNAVDQINKKYDEQEKALTKIYEINQDIAEQEKERVSLADAITQGDISAASQAAQSIRAGNASRASSVAQELLGQVRDAEVAGVRGTLTGLTSDEIGARQYQIDRLGYSLSTQRLAVEKQIEAKQEQIYQIEVKRQEIYKLITNLEDRNFALTEQIKIADEILKKELEAIDAQRRKWEQAQLAIDIANTKTDAFQNKLKTANDILNEVSKLWNNLTDKNLRLTIKQIEDAIQGKSPAQQPPATKESANFMAALALADNGEQIQTAITKAVADKISPTDIANAIVVPLQNIGMSIAEATSSARYTGQALQYEAAAKAKANTEKASEQAPVVRLSPGDFRKMESRGLSTGGLVPKFFAAGGFARGTDRIPAMLTPGEFVVRKNAVDNIGVNNLNKINDGSAPGNSVYNYSVDINVANSDASSSDIARAVIGQIKYIDSQRIRGQR